MINLPTSPELEAELLPEVRRVSELPIKTVLVQFDSDMYDEPIAWVTIVFDKKVGIKQISSKVLRAISDFLFDRFVLRMNEIFPIPVYLTEDDYLAKN